MKLLSTLALALLASAPALAQNSVTIDFEGAPGYVHAIGDFYNGGTDSLGRSGPNYGVSFTDSLVGLSNDALGPYYAGAPSPLTVAFAVDSNAFMNVAAGFSGALTFSYSSTEAVANAVSVYSGLNGTGSLLGSIGLLGNAQLGCRDTAFCRFDALDFAFAGIGRSIGLGVNANAVLYDNITVTPVPEPQTYLLMFAGLAVVLGAHQRRRKAAA